MFNPRILDSPVDFLVVRIGDRFLQEHLSIKYSEVG